MLTRQRLALHWRRHMTDDLVKRLKEGACLENQLEAHELTKEAASRIEELEALVRQYRDAVAQIGHWIKTWEVPK